MYLINADWYASSTKTGSLRYSETKIAITRGRNRSSNLRKWDSFCGSEKHNSIARLTAAVLSLTANPRNTVGVRLKHLAQSKAAHRPTWAIDQEIQNDGSSFRLNSFERQIVAIQLYAMGYAFAVLNDKLFHFFRVAANFLDLLQSGIGPTMIAQFPDNQLTQRFALGTRLRQGRVTLFQIVPHIHSVSFRSGTSSPHIVRPHHGYRSNVAPPARWVPGSAHDVLVIPIFSNISNCFTPRRQLCQLSKPSQARKVSHPVQWV